MLGNGTDYKNKNQGMLIFVSQKKSIILAEHFTIDLLFNKAIPTLFSEKKDNPGSRFHNLMQVTRKL